MGAAENAQVSHAPAQQGSRTSSRVGGGGGLAAMKLCASSPPAAAWSLSERPRGASAGFVHRELYLQNVVRRELMRGSEYKAEGLPPRSAPQWGCLLDPNSTYTFLTKGQGVAQSAPT